MSIHRNLSSSFRSLDPRILARGLDQLHVSLQSAIDRGEVAGAVTLLSRHGKIADVHAYGYSNLEQRIPMKRDSLFRIASLTKIVTAVAVLKCVESGKLALEDPVAQFVPELANMRVLTRHGDGPVRLIDARPFTIRQLLTHTSGLASAETASGDLRLHYVRLEEPSYPLFTSSSPRSLKFPWSCQPGERSIYGLSYAVLGYLVQVCTGQRFEDYLQTQLFGPLKMLNTYFQIPKEEQERLACTYVHEAGQPLRRRVTEGVPYHLGGPGYPRGGGGLVSTIDDFARFGQMLLNGGTLDEVCILNPVTVEAMTSDQLKTVRGKKSFLKPFDSYGLGVSVRTQKTSESIWPHRAIWLDWRLHHLLQHKPVGPHSRADLCPASTMERVPTIRKIQQRALCGVDLVSRFN